MQLYTYFLYNNIHYFFKISGFNKATYTEDIYINLSFEKIKC